MHDLNVMADANWTRGWGLGIELSRRGERVFGGHTGGFPGFLSILAYSRRDRIGAVVLTNAGNWPNLSATGLELAEAALEELAPELEPWAARGAAAGRDRAAARALVVGGGRVDLQLARRQARSSFADAPPEREPSVFEPEGEDRFRVVSGRERGEVLRVVRDEPVRS